MSLKSWSKWIKNTYKKYGFYTTLCIQKHGIQKELFWKLFLPRYKRRAKNNHILKKIINNYMLLNLEDVGLCKELLTIGIREMEQTKLMKQLVKPGMTILEIGANVGYYALIEAEQMQGKGKIYAIEPIPKSFTLLQTNVWVNGYWKLFDFHNIAISNKNKMIEIYETKHLNCSSINLNKDTDVVKKHKIKAMTVDKFLKGKKLPDIVRMDVEGHELEIFEGMKNLLKTKWNMTLFVEFHPVHMPNKKKLKQMKKLLRDLITQGFRPIAITDSGGFTKVKHPCIEDFDKLVCEKYLHPGVFMMRGIEEPPYQGF